eukprot:1194108-Prorocentrum_minimum.AAC.2
MEPPPPPAGVIWRASIGGGGARFASAHKRSERCKSSARSACAAETDPLRFCLDRSCGCGPARPVYYGMLLQDTITG